MLYRTFPSGKIKGINSWMGGMQSQGLGFPETLSYPMNWQNQIDEVVAAGGTMWRCPDSNQEVMGGTFTASQHLNVVAQMISYCHSKGIWYYGTVAHTTFAPLQSVTTDLTTAQNAIVAYLSQYFQLVAGFPNVFACDIWNESDVTLFGSGSWNGLHSPGPPYEATQFHYTMTFAQCQAFVTQIFNAARANAPNLALTTSHSSVNISSSSWSDSVIQWTAPFCDFIDQHVYYNPLNSGDLANAYSITGVSGKYVFCSERGDDYTDGATTRQNYLSSAWNNLVNYSVAGQPSCPGFCWWSLQDLPPWPQTNAEWKSGLYDEQTPPVLRGTPSSTQTTDIGPQFEGYSCARPFFTSAFPKTGWGM